MNMLVLTAPLSSGLSEMMTMNSGCKNLSTQTTYEKTKLENRDIDVYDQFSNVLVCEKGFLVTLSLQDFLKKFPINDAKNEEMYINIMLTHPEQAYLFV